MEVAMTSLTQRSRLTADDRCDRCGAQAYVQVELLAGALLFCAHHARQYQDKLTEVAIVIHDETSRLAEALTTAVAVSGVAQN
jgi:ribosomal protein L37E